MDIRQQAITEYLTEGTTFRDLAAKYGISRTTINKWVQIHQGIHNIAPTPNQQNYYLTGMNSKPENISSADFKNQKELEQKIALLEKQLAWEKLRADALFFTKQDKPYKKAPGKPNAFFCMFNYKTKLRPAVSAVFFLPVIGRVTFFFFLFTFRCL